MYSQINLRNFTTCIYKSFQLTAFNYFGRSGYKANTWFLITGVFKNNFISLFIDGALDGFEEINGDINLNYSRLLIGTRSSLPSSPFYGIITDVRIYDTALSEVEISEF